MRYTYTKKKMISYLKFRFTWVTCISSGSPFTPGQDASTCTSLGLPRISPSSLLKKPFLSPDPAPVLHTVSQGRAPTKAEQSAEAGRLVPSAGCPQGPRWPRCPAHSRVLHSNTRDIKEEVRKGHLAPLHFQPSEKSLSGGEH